MLNSQYCCYLYLSKTINITISKTFNLPASLQYGGIVTAPASSNYWSFMQISNPIHKAIMHSGTMVKRRAENNGSKYSSI